MKFVTMKEIQKQAAGVDFPEKILFALKWAKRAQNVPKKESS